MNTKPENVAADGVRRPRGRRMREFGILSAMSLVAATALVGADRAVNSFVTVEGEGVSLDADGSICVDEGSSGSLTVSARPGWLVNGRESVTGNPANGTLRDLSMTSRLGESTQHLHVFPFTEREEHVTDECNELSVTVDPCGIVKVYALPAASAEVSAEATATVARKARHRKVKTYSKCSFRGCNERHDPEVEYGEPFEVEPDRYAWTATAEGQTSNGSAWTGYMGKGLGKEIKFHVKGTRGNCQKCICEADAEAKADVYELSIDLPDELLGLDLRDAMKGKYVTRGASAKIEPEPASATYEWLSCGQCDFIGDTDKVDVTYGATDEKRGSISYRAEDLVVNATVTNEDGLPASANCTTNFTVVRVDFVLDGIGEDGDEKSKPDVYYVADNKDGSLSEFGLLSLMPATITCTPADDRLGAVELSILSVRAELYEITDYEMGESGKPEPAQAELAQESYPCSEIAAKKFGVHGHVNGGILNFDRMCAEHKLSKAIDMVDFKVVPPPPLEVTVRFDSPADGGGWPYDPVWDDPEWAPTVNGILAKQCAEDTDEALVIYALSRDASKVEGSIYKSIPLWLDDEVEKLRGMDPSEGVHTNSWDIGPTRKTDVYYAEVVAIDKETGKPRKAESNDGEVSRKSYYESTASDDMIVKEYVITDMQVESLQTSLTASGFIVGTALVPAHWLVGTISGLGWWKLTSLPSWYKGGTQISNAYWMVTRYAWDGDKYTIPAAVYLSSDSSQTIINSVFEMGYEKIVSNTGSGTQKIVTYFSKETVVQGMIPTIGFDSISTERFTTSENWIWAPVPGGGYGLLCPKCCE